MFTTCNTIAEKEQCIQVLARQIKDLVFEVVGSNEESQLTTLDIVDEITPFLEESVANHIRGLGEKVSCCDVVKEALSVLSKERKVGSREVPVEEYPELKKEVYFSI